MHHIQGEFSVELSPQADEINTGRMLLNKTYKGALCGTSEGQMLSVRTDTPGSAGYVAIEQFSGTLDGKAGSFALQHSGTMNRGEASLTVSVMCGTQTTGFLWTRYSALLLRQSTLQ